MSSLRINLHIHEELYPETYRALKNLGSKSRAELIRKQTEFAFLFQKLGINNGHPQHDNTQNQSYKGLQNINDELENDELDSDIDELFFNASKDKDHG